MSQTRLRVIGREKIRTLSYKEANVLFHSKRKFAVTVRKIRVRSDPSRRAA